jgi:MYXO-CTERM domain-containing protein
VRGAQRDAVPRLGEVLLTLAAGLAAAIPVIAATVRAVQAGWVPVADRGIIATRAHDVFTLHMPLVGQYTLAGEVTGQVTHSLGPMLFWLLAPTAYGGSDVGMTLTMGAVNTLCIVGCVALARRRSGRVLMAMTALAIALMCQSLAAETFHDVWNPSAGLFPFTLLIFLCWSLACGEYRLAPLTVLVASFVVQTHLTYLPPTLALLAVACGSLAAGWIAGRRRGAVGPERRSLLVWGLATVLVAAFCWSATIDGQLTEHPGNLTLVAEAATRHKATLGSQVGWHAVVRAVGVVPWWLHTPASRWQRKYEVRSRPSALATDSTIAMLAALVLVGLVALRRRRRDVAALALIALVLCPALAAVAADTPTPRLLSATLGYTMWWGSQVGVVVWLTLAWAGWLGLARSAPRLTGAVRRRRAGGHGTSATDMTAPITGLTAPTNDFVAPASGPAGRISALAPILLAVLAIAAVGDTVAVAGKSDEHVIVYRPIKAIDARLSQLIPRGGSVLLEGNLDGATMPVKPAVRYFLVARGTRVLAPGSDLRLGSWYELYGRPYREAVYLSDIPWPPAKGVQLVFHVGFLEGSTLNTVYVWRSRQPRR